jgi:branched-chain amino acid transport system ATP-binding protein
MAMVNQDKDSNTVILETRKVTKDFGGLRAVNEVNFQLKRGELMSIIGPNGAGKTTFFNLLSGHLRPTSGEILFMGKNVRKMPAYERCRLGIGRSFQLTNIFPDLTTFENVRVAAQSRKRTFSFWSNWSRYKDINEKADEILNRIGLYKKRDHLASTLAYGEQRYLEIGITLATDPLVLLLDEPTSGMSPEESRQVADFVKELSQEVDILLVEHDMHFVMTISDKVTCLENGTVIACDSPAEIRNNSRVQACYLREKIC